MQGQSREPRLPSASTITARSCRSCFAFSHSIQRNMYNYKGYKKGSDINRQKYTELLFTCLSNVRKSSYTHTIKKERMPSDL